MKIRANTGNECRDCFFEGGVSAWSIDYSVGIGGRNKRDDVRKIQKLLNLISPTDGGPIVPLVEDGWIGPKTNKAILAFQRFQRTGSDGKVDPHGPTLKRMNEVSKSRLATNNAHLLARVASVMGELKQMTTKGRRMIDGAINYLMVGDGMFASKRDYEMADLYFDFSKLSQGATRAALSSIKTTFNRAHTVLLSRPSPVTGGNPLGISIFTIDPMGHDHMAYVPTHRPVNQREHPDVHPGHVYLCQKIGTTVRDKFTHILMHELFHFVDDEGFLYIKDHGYREKVFKLRHRQRMTNSDNYALFASHVHFGRERLLLSQPTLRPHIPTHLQ